MKLKNCNWNCLVLLGYFPLNCRINVMVQQAILSVTVPIENHAHAARGPATGAEDRHCACTQSCNVSRAAIPSLLVVSLLQIRYLTAQTLRRPPHSRLLLQEHGCEDGMMIWRFGWQSLHFAVHVSGSQAAVRT
jgi:hypothetical protein